MLSNFADRIYVGAAVLFILKLRDNNEVIDDLAFADTIEINFSLPDNTVITRTASLHTNGKDGEIQYESIPGTDLTLAGMWHLQAKVVYAGKPYFSDIERFLVHPRLV